MAQNQQRYRVLEKIAAGGMAEVYRAESAGVEGFKKTVAIKRVLPHLAGKKQFIGMFLDEARLSAHLSHSNCVQVFDIGVGDDTFFIVMEYVDGADLKGVIEFCKKRGHTVPVEESVLTCVKICEGLSYAHELRDGSGVPLHIVHRDMSPPNVLITRYGEVKIVDFGLAKANSQLEKSEPGIIKGKFSYLSPEAARGEPVDHRTDIFAVGIILWEMLAGRRLFMGDTDLETVRQVQAARVPSVRQFNPDVSPELERVLMRGLTSDPRDRYQTAREFGQELTAVLYSLGRAVSSFDIAKLVSAVVVERDKKRAAERPDKGSIIGSLIQDALFEFSSLEQDGEASPDDGRAPAGSGALNLGSFEDVGGWADDIGGSPLGGGPTSSGFEVGNLAALEDDSPSVRPPPGPAAAAPLRAVERSALAPAPLAPASFPPVPAQAASGGGKGGFVAVVVLLVLLAGAAGAYFGGLFPR
jgi:eukaryotic-like serine/threonine-protein kinase